MPHTRRLGSLALKPRAGKKNNPRLVAEGKNAFCFPFSPVLSVLAVEPTLRQCVGRVPLNSRNDRVAVVQARGE